MSTLAHRPASSVGSRLANRVLTVCVVDPQVIDYHSWDSIAEGRGVRVHFVPSCEAALTLARTQPVDHWVVNAELPGLSGCELCSMLKTRDSRAAVYLVANEYSVEVEQAAWQARATLFGCKPDHTRWLDEWLSAYRHGPPPCSNSSPNGARSGS